MKTANDNFATQAAAQRVANRLNETDKNVFFVVANETTSNGSFWYLEDLEQIDVYTAHPRTRKGA